MPIGDVWPVDTMTDCYVVDTGMFDAPWFGSVYLLDGDRPALVDSGIGADRSRVTAACDELGIAPEVILLTHVHLDHAGGAGALADRYDATVYVHDIGVPHLVDPERLVAGTRDAVGDAWRYYEDPRPVPEDRIVGLTGGDRVTLGDRELVAHAAPGHAPHQLVYHDPTEDAVFTGDAAGVYVPPLDRVLETTPPPQFDLDTCLADLETIRTLEPETLLYGHFGPASIESDEPAASSDRLDAYATTLRDWVATVREARDSLAATSDTESVTADAVAERLSDRVERTAGVWGREKARAEVVLNVSGVLARLE